MSFLFEELIICGISAPVQRLVPGAIEVGILQKGFSPEALEGLKKILWVSMHVSQWFISWWSCACKPRYLRGDSTST
jgi:hypothetical protein